MFEDHHLDALGGGSEDLGVGSPQDDFSVLAGQIAKLQGYTATDARVKDTKARKRKIRTTQKQRKPTPPPEASQAKSTGGKKSTSKKSTSKKSTAKSASKSTGKSAGQKRSAKSKGKSARPASASAAGETHTNGFPASASARRSAIEVTKSIRDRLNSKLSPAQAKALREELLKYSQAQRRKQWTHEEHKVFEKYIVKYGNINKPAMHLKTLMRVSCKLPHKSTVDVASRFNKLFGTAIRLRQSKQSSRGMPPPAPLRTFDMSTPFSQQQRQQQQFQPQHHRQQHRQQHQQQYAQHQQQYALQQPQQQPQYQQHHHQQHHRQQQQQQQQQQRQQQQGSRLRLAGGAGSVTPGQVGLLQHAVAGLSANEGLLKQIRKGILDLDFKDSHSKAAHFLANLNELQKTLQQVEPNLPALDITPAQLNAPPVKREASDSAKTQMQPPRQPHQQQPQPQMVAAGGPTMQ